MKRFTLIIACLLLLLLGALLFAWQPVTAQVGGYDLSWVAFAAGGSAAFRTVAPGAD